MGEDDLLGWLRRQQIRTPGSDLDSIGDDTAILPAESWAVTVDTQIEGVHFHPGLDPRLLARRLLAVNLSDLAASGASPAYAFLVIAAPSSFDHKRFFRAFLQRAEPLGLSLAGGDLASQPTVHVSLTLLGRRLPGGRWLRRDGAAVGHGLWLGGTVGESAAGCLLMAQGAALEGRRVVLPEAFEGRPSLARAARRAVRRHLEPNPQLDLGMWLAEVPEGGVIDLSDGLAKDLHRLCDASGVGAVLETKRLPLAPSGQPLAQALGTDNLSLALGGGEDYVLLFTLPDGMEPPDALGCQQVGRITRGRNIQLLDHSGALGPLEAQGWDHLER